MRNKVNSTFEGNKVPRLTKFLYPFSGIFRDACYALVGSFLLTYAMTTGVLSSDPDTYTAQYGVITIAMMIALVWDGINDPIMGFIIEKCHFKTGKFKPWILIGAIGNAIVVTLMFCLRPGGDGWGFVGTMIAFYFLWDLFFTMNDVGYWSMLPSLTSDEHERASLTSRVTIAASIGGFLMTGICFLLPSMFAGEGGKGAGEVYAIISIVCSILFLLGQAAIYFFCQERKRDIKQEEISEQSHFLDLFKIVGKNKQLRLAVISMFLFYLASGVLTGGIGLYYFYLNLGYGSWQGGLCATLISVMYVAGNVGAQALYPTLAKKFSKQKLLTVMSIIGFLAYAGFFLFCFPVFGEHPLAYNDPTPYIGATHFIDDMGKGLAWSFGGTMILYYLFPLIFFFTEGFIYMIILVMFQNAIDYGEYEYGERKESVAFAWRPLDVKLSSALLRAFQYMIFAIAGVSGYFSAVSSAEGTYNSIANTPGTSQSVISEAAADRNTAIYNAGVGVERWQLVVYGIIAVGIVVASMLALYLILHLGYKIDEEKEKEIALVLEQRHKENEKKAAIADALQEKQPVVEAAMKEEIPEQKQRQKESN